MNSFFQIMTALCWFCSEPAIETAPHESNFLKSEKCWREKFGDFELFHRFTNIRAGKPDIFMTIPVLYYEPLARLKLRKRQGGPLLGFNVNNFGPLDYGELQNAKSSLNTWRASLLFQNNTYLERVLLGKILTYTPKQYQESSQSEIDMGDGLYRLDYELTDAEEHLYRQYVYVLRGDDGILDGVLVCTPDTVSYAAGVKSCVHYLRHRGMDVKFRYRRDHFGRLWEIEGQVRKMVDCSIVSAVE